MSFVSPWFPLFLVVVLAGLALMPSRGARHAFLLVASLAFYAFGSPAFILVLLVPAIVDYACAIRMEESGDAATRRRWLLLSLVVNLGVLIYFKYANFLIDSIAAVFGIATAPLAIMLPVGISFFTFKTMSYTIDVYRGQLPACRSLRDYTMFVSFFPELVAGPIVRASVFLPQMGRHLRWSWRRLGDAMPLILLGFTKKLLVADRLAVFVDPVFQHPEIYSRGTIGTAVVAYSLQIYCDFSGYTDIAIGVARIIGFDLPENFNMPYLATSITEFWRRWHMTLSAWLRDYLYIPLGGNRHGRTRTYVNLVITMLLGGLWHGASWTFVLWGLFHGLGLAIHKRWREHRDAAGAGPLPAAIGWLATYAFVCAGWILFRATSLGAAATIFRRLVGPATGGIEWFFLPFWILLPLVVLAHIAGRAAQASEDFRPGHTGRAITPNPAVSYGFLRGALPTGPMAGAFLITAWVIIMFLFAPVNRVPFIYFQF